MKINQAKILIRSAITQTVDLSDEQLILLNDNTQDFMLFSDTNNIDSLDLVSILADIETSVDDTMGISILLSSDKAMSSKNSPFRSVESLASFLIQEIANVSP